MFMLRLSTVILRNSCFKNIISGRTMASLSTRLRDPNTLSNYDKFRTKHITANFKINFEKKRLEGNVALSFEVIEKADKLVLDTSHLDLEDVTIDGAKAVWDLADRKEPYGSALSVDVGRTAEIGKELVVTIKLSTTEQCTALQWLTPEQTSNKKHPYMFSQCQAIHARSIFPCQDTPDVKATVNFNIESSLPVLASGLPISDSESSSDTKIYHFEQKVPIPSYLFALASGDIKIASIGPRSNVATGPGELDASKWELEDDMERFIVTAEKILQTVPYAWGTYNVLVLPPSFPYGGMENPVYTFATPSIISGDRENIDVIAHELAHSWSGNLVSNGSWEHFWLNEGWTVYLERRILAAIQGESYRDFSAIIGWKALTDSVNHYGADHEFTKLIVNLKGADPDDAFSSIPYEKGSTFLWYLERLVGKDNFDKFIPHYFSTFAKKSLDSFQFKDNFITFFEKDEKTAAKLKEIDWDTWFYKPGLPPKPDFDTSMVDVAYNLASKWEGNSKGDTDFKPSPDDIKDLSANQLVVFLEKVQGFEPKISPEASQAMGKAYGFSRSKNLELTARYYQLALRAGDKTAEEPAVELLGTIGRMKFVRPLFRSLKIANEKLAIEAFKKYEAFYHPICRQMVKQDLFSSK